MAQRRSWEYKADDVTIDLDRWKHGIELPGVYQGFDFGTQDSWMLHLVHSVTGTKYVTKEPAALTDFIGVFKTRQGLIISEDEGIDIPISEADPTNPRIDLIFGTHEYITSNGGQEAFYSVLQGTPAANPTAPVVPNDLIDIPIATLYIPAAITDLSDSGVIYTRSEVPTMANENYANRDKVNLYKKQSQGPLDANASSSVAGNLIFLDESNHYNYSGSDTITYLPSKPGGTVIKIKVLNASGMTLVHSASPAFATINLVDVGSVFNFVDSETTIYPQNSILEFNALEDGSWILSDYSVYPVWNKVNAFKKAQQFPFGSGIILRHVTYVVSSISYTNWIIEIDASAQNHILDLNNSAQMNGFNPSTDTIFIKAITVINGGSNGFKTVNSSLANGGDITIKILNAIGASNVTVFGKLISSNPVPTQTGNYIYLSNNFELVNYLIDGSNMALGYIGNSNVEGGEFKIKIAPGSKFNLNPINALAYVLGGTSYTNTNFYTTGTSYRSALDALSASASGSSVSDTMLGTTSLGNVTSLVTAIQTFKIGKLKIVTGTMKFNFDRVNSFFDIIFNNIDGDIPVAPGSTNLSHGFGHDTDNIPYTYDMYKSGSSMRVTGHHLSGSSGTADVSFYLIWVYKIA